MTFEQLEFIVAVQQEGTLTAAAQVLNISHSAISRAISSLEAELGVNIFVRSRSGTALTEQGEMILQSARTILREANQLRALTRADTNRELMIKAFPIDSMSFLADAVALLREAYHHVTVNLAGANVTEIVADLKAQKVDFGLLLLPSAGKDILGSELKYKTLIRSRLMVACNKESDLAEKNILTPEDLKGHPFILHKDPIIIAALRKLFHDEEFLDVLTYSNDNSFIKRMVVEGKALGLYTELLQHADPYTLSGQLLLKPLLCEENLDSMEFLCAYSAKKQFSAMERDFLRMLVKLTRIG